jgi:hypothetical protein
MKFDGLVDAKKVQGGFKKLPKEIRRELFNAMRKSMNEGVALARTLAPIGSGKPDPDLGRLKDGIHGKMVVRKDIIMASVEAAPPEKQAQIKARAVEFGRKNDRVGLGTTQPHPFITRAQQLLREKHKRRQRSAINKAAKRALNG